MHERAEQQPGRWMALVGKTPADVRDYQVEGPGGLLKNAPLWCLDAPGGPWPHYEPSKRRLTWPNGAWATVYSSEEPDGIRGFSGDTAWLDEFAKYPNPREVWDNLQFGLREISEDRPRVLITTTPRDIPLLLEIEELPDTVVVIGSTYENRGNLSPTFFSKTVAAYEGTRVGRREIHAEYVGLTEGRVYASFSKSLFPAGNIDPSVVDNGAELYVGQDFNVEPMASVVCQKVADECHVLASIEIDTSNTDEVCEELRSRYPGEKGKPRRIIMNPDPAGNQRHTNAPVGETDFTIIRRHGIVIHAPSSHPLVVDRVNNTEAMLLQGTRRRVRIHPSCTALIRALAGLTYKAEKQPGPDGRTQYTSIRDKGSGLDHICDALDYHLWQEHNVLTAPAHSRRVLSPFG